MPVRISQLKRLLCIIAPKLYKSEFCSQVTYIVNFAVDVNFAVGVIYRSLKYRLLLEPRGIAVAYANMNMRLYLCMQTRSVNWNQIARGLILTYPELLVTFIATARDARMFKFMLLRIAENCCAWKRRDRPTVLRTKECKNVRIYHSVVAIFRHWMSRGIFF